MVRDLIKIWCAIRKNAKLTDGIRELTALREAGFVSIGCQETKDMKGKCTWCYSIPVIASMLNCLLRSSAQLL